MRPSILRFRPGVDLPGRAYLDTNLLIRARDQLSRKYAAASACLAELIRQDVELNVSALVFDELWWGLFKLSYRLLTGRELTAQEYQHHAEIWKTNWPVIRRISDEILGWGRVNVLESAGPVGLVRDAAALIDANPLAPRDAFHLAITLQHGIPSVVTADRAFDNVQLPEGRNLTIVKF